MMQPRAPTTFLRPVCTGHVLGCLLLLPLWLVALPLSEARLLAKSGREGEQQHRKPFLSGDGIAVLQARWPELDLSNEIIATEKSLPTSRTLVDAAAVADKLAEQIAQGPQPSKSARVRSAVQQNHISPGGQALSSAALGAMTGGKAMYTTNMVCLPRYCVNPIFPALKVNGHSVLTENQQKKWKCVKDPSQAWKSAGFCGQIVSSYHFAVPEPVNENQNLSIIEQEHHAINAYVAHMSGIGHDFWDYTQPWNHDACTQAVWKMACYTYFPRCNALDASAYLRPCASTCQDYVSKCKVECCDEGTQCTFQHDTVLANGTTVVEDGYVPHSGPSPLCTGNAPPHSGGQLCLSLAGALLLVAALSDF